MGKTVRIELDGRRYAVRFHENGAAIAYQIVKTAKGGETLKTLNGHGRAFRPETIGRVIAAAKAQFLKGGQA